NNSISCSSPPVARDQDSIGKFEGQNCRRFRRHNFCAVIRRTNLSSRPEQTVTPEQGGKITARPEIERLFAVHLLAGALPVTLRLVRIYPAHLFQQILRVRSRDIG